MSNEPQKREEEILFRSELLGEGGIPAGTEIRGGIRRGHFTRNPRKKKEPIRLGKDEMNLIEHPFGILWEKEPDDSVMYYAWDNTDPETGKIIPASWTVAGHPDHGLPRGSDERLYLVMMELTREARFESPVVYFSRHDVLKRLGWNTGQRSYDQLKGALNRLQGVTINAENAFYNPKRKNYSTVAFNVIDLFRLDTMNADGTRDERGPSLWKWSDVLFDSFQDGFIRSIDLEFALSIKGDIALRLYRYLDKKTYDGRRTFEIDLFNLCIGHLGMKPNLYPSKLKERLKPAHDELLARGFLTGIEFEKTRTTGRKSEKVRYRFGDIAPAEASLSSSEPKQSLLPPLQPTLFDAPSPAVLPALPAPVQEPVEGGEPDAQRAGLLERMEAIRVSPQIARELLDQWPASAIEHQLDCLDDRKPRSKPATFVKSVREMWALPDEYVSRVEAQEREQKRRVEQEEQEAEKARQKAAERAETARLEQEGAQLDAMWEKLDAVIRERIDAEVNGKLGILGRTGRGDAAKIAFRRAALRELLGQAMRETGA